MTIQPGAITGQTSLAVPGGTAPGDHVVEARAGASIGTATLHVVPIPATLVSFTLTPNTLPSTGGTLVAEVGLDQPAPTGGVVVDIVAATWNVSHQVSFPAGSTSAQEQLSVPWVPFGIVTQFTFTARLAGTALTATTYRR